MRYPEFLKENGTIGFVAPSFGCSTEPYRTAFNHALDKWKKEGYGIDIGPNCYENSGVGISNTPEKCAEELTEWYCRKENDILISCGGGELMCEVLPFVDFERIRKADTDFAAILATVATICKDVIQPGVIIEPPIWFYIRFYAEQHGIPRPRLYLRQRGFCPLR